MDNRACSRRSFLQGLSAALPLSVLPLDTETTETHPSAPAAVRPGPRTYFNTATRLTIAMWDFSWLKANHPGGAYEDLERRVAEAAERGYNTLRIDCFPSRVLEPESHFEKNWNPGVNLPQWGQTAVSFSVNVREKVAELARLCRKYNIWLGLDSWDKNHMFGHSDRIAEADEEREFTRYGETFARALRLMREDGVLERAVWVAPMNEVPHFGSRALASLADLRRSPLHEGETELVKNRKEDEIYRRINQWMGEPIVSEISRDRIPLSYSSLAAERYANRLTDIYDVVDVHFMPPVITDRDDEAALAAASRGIRPPHRFNEFEKMDLKAYSRAWDRACRKNYRAMLDRARQFHTTALDNMTLSSGKRLTAVNTEPFGPCFWPDHPDVSWNWYKRYNADALRVISALDFAGTSLSNYAEPLFSLWEDVDWHFTSNTYFLSAT